MFLPTELLARICHLSTEGESEEAKQRARCSFSLISRAFYLATPDTTAFYITSDSQAMALTAKLEREKEWATQEERKTRSNGRASRRSSTLNILHISNVQRLVIYLNNDAVTKGFSALLRATPNLLALELDATRSVQGSAASFIKLESALAGLRNLKELKCRGLLDERSILRILISLPSVEELDLPNRNYIWCIIDDWGALNLPHLRKLGIILQSQRDDFANTLVRSTRGIQELDLHSTPIYIFSSDMYPTLAHLIHFSWHPDESEPIGTSTRDEILTRVGEMTHLHSISLSMWCIRERDWTPDTPVDEWPIDPSRFNTLATLPSLHTVKLTIRGGRLNPTHLISFIESHTILRSVDFRFIRAASRWSDEQRGRIEQAAERAGVAFTD